MRKRDIACTVVQDNVFGPYAVRVCLDTLLNFTNQDCVETYLLSQLQDRKLEQLITINAGYPGDGFVYLTD